MPPIELSTDAVWTAKNDIRDAYSSADIITASRWRCHWNLLNTAPYVLIESQFWGNLCKHLFHENLFYEHRSAVLMICTSRTHNTHNAICSPGTATRRRGRLIDHPILRAWSYFMSEKPSRIKSPKHAQVKLIGDFVWSQG